MDFFKEAKSWTMSLNIWQSILLLLALFIAYPKHVLAIIYRLTLHPLARYPGPFFSKISDWSIVFQTLTGDRHLRQLKEHEVYGPFVRIGPNTLSINTISALKEVYANRKANVQKTEWYRTIDSGTGAMSTHSEVDRDRHAFRRRVLDHAFSDGAIRSAETFILENIRTWCEHLGEGAEPGEWITARNMSDWCTYVAYDIMGDLVFGKRFNVMENDEHRHVPAMMIGSMKLIYPAAYIPCQTIIRPILNSQIMLLLGGQMARDNVAFMEYANSQIAMRKDAEAEALISGEPHRKDFMYYLLSASDKETGKGLTKTELDADSGLLISAGADTTSITLAALLFYLIHNPRALHRAVHEIRTTFPSSCFSVEDIVSGPRLNSLTYTRSCIEEALRLSPPVPTHLPRQVLPGGLTISGHFLPQGTIVGTSAYAIHHNPEYYPDPFAFKPERWIVDDKAGNDIGTTAESVATAKAAFCAFSLGTRGCIGKSLAYMEMMLAIARLLWLFDMEKAEPPCGKSAESNEGSGASAPWLTGEGDPSAAEGGRRRIDEYQLWDRFLSAREGPMVRFRRVDGRIMEDRM